MKFQVWYRTDTHFRDAYKVTRLNIDPTHYFKVGEVEATNLGDLFRRMNCVDGSEYECVGSGPGQFQVRSMSVGDMAIDEHGRGYLCCSIGWEEVSLNFGDFGVSRVQHEV